MPLDYLYFSMREVAHMLTVSEEEKRVELFTSSDGMAVSEDDIVEVSAKRYKRCRIKNMFNKIKIEESEPK